MSAKFTQKIGRLFDGAVAGLPIRFAVVMRSAPILRCVGFDAVGVPLVRGRNRWQLVVVPEPMTLIFAVVIACHYQAGVITSLRISLRFL